MNALKQIQQRLELSHRASATADTLTRDALNSNMPLTNRLATIHLAVRLRAHPELMLHLDELRMRRHSSRDESK